jgi:CheY-like chemotaxis protein
MARILLVEDDLDTQDIYRTSLEHAGYSVLTASDGEEGLSRALAAVPDLSLLDIMLPKMPGWEVAQRLRTDERTRRVPIIAVSRTSFPANAITRRNLGSIGS